MAGTRDDFPKPTRIALALRAGYLCSICGRGTVGPSDERPDAVMQIGVAAHICAAAPGPGARRYDPNMTREERAGIGNGIWLCSSCSVIIDRDEVAYPIGRLRQLKIEHEASCRLDQQHQSDSGSDDLIAIGPNIVAVGHVIGSSSSGLRVRLSHFVVGAGNDLLTFAGDFERVPALDRYVLLNELGYGRTLSAGPEVTRAGTGFEVSLDLYPSEARVRADSFGAGVCRHTGRVIRGMDVFAQHLEFLLGLAVGDYVFHPLQGSRVSKFYNDYAGSPWLARFIKMDLIRLASIPIPDKLNRTNVTPLRCVNTLRNIVLPEVELNGQYLRIHVEFDLEGMGIWQRETRVFIYTNAQLEQAGRREIPELLRDMNPIFPGDNRD